MHARQIWIHAYVHIYVCTCTHTCKYHGFIILKHVWHYKEVLESTRFVKVIIVLSSFHVQVDTFIILVNVLTWIAHGGHLVYPCLPSSFPWSWWLGLIPIGSIEGRCPHAPFPLWQCIPLFFAFLQEEIYHGNNIFPIIWNQNNK